MKYNPILLWLLLLSSLPFFPQAKPEREHRIKKSQFPAIERVAKTLEDAKNLKYYKEVDSAKITYILKFKMKKMWYHIDFNEKGDLQNMGFKVKEVDIPADTYANISSFLENNFERIKIRHILQCYSGTSDKDIKNIFQNLILPTNTYELMICGEKPNKKEEYMVLFDAEGNLLNLNVALPANYDHVLY